MKPDDLRLGNIEWRLDNLYQIIDKYGRQIKFVRNESQLRLWGDLSKLNLILKDRQRGFSTFIAVLILDNCLFNRDQSCAIVDLTLDDAKLKLSKIRFAYEQLPLWLKDLRMLLTDNKESLEWDNGSSVQVGTSHRGGTTQILHVSEYGPISARRPDQAREIRTGALNTVAPGCYVFVESTAEGRGGDFYNYVQDARKAEASGEMITDYDFKLHFFAWWHGRTNVLDADGVNISDEHEKYFQELEIENRMLLSAEQKAWYAKKSKQQGDDMVREYPGTIDEAFESSVQGAYYAKQFLEMRKDGRLTSVPHVVSLPVVTFWDLGMGDDMAVWFAQMVGREWHLIDYEFTTGEGFPFWAVLLRDKKYIYDGHMMPHDAKVHEIGSGVSRAVSAEQLGISPVSSVRRAINTEVLNQDIQTTRDFLSACFIDAKKCAKGIDALENYTKQWDERNAVFKNKPLHNWASNGADALRTGAVCIKDNGYTGFRPVPQDMVVHANVYA